MNIGARLRAARTQRKLSQRELARRAGVTNGTISQIEQNHSSPSVSSLKRVLDALAMSLAEFFAADVAQSHQVFFRRSELQEVNPHKLLRKTDAPIALSIRQVGDALSHQIQMLHECYSPGADTGAQKYSHDAEEAGIVIEGSIEVTVGAETETLFAGDAYLFDSRIPHRFHNTGTEDCVIVSACTPPSF
ncbi:cupin domain-containing protein (plasmid) [Pseudorhodobacter turbinis]|uniref:Cupin domain-containing protein n=1 Tax=Pseudorhodobacter turbinis TaxID=2500533 RepID=A0A4P8EMI7_9RHOB|nr:cupin domain-containing protein [Pseudorhodobacter turbinis]